MTVAGRSRSLFRSLDWIRATVMTTEKAKPLTAADRAALASLPQSGWFDVAFAPIARPSYRCERLELAGLLERRVVDVKVTDGHFSARTEYRRIVQN